MQWENVISRVRSGDRSAVRELVATYGERVYARAYAKTKDASLAKEATRKAFSAAISEIKRDPSADGWSLWLDVLTERSIEESAEISAAVKSIGSELERELFSAAPSERAPLVPTPEPSRQPSPEPSRQPKSPQADSPLQQNPAQTREPVRPAPRKTPRPIAETFDEAPRSHGGFSVVLFILLCALLLWVVAGIGMSMGWLPKYDLGFTWFNEHVFKLF